MRRLRRYLVAGILVWAPLAVTFLLLRFAVNLMDKTLRVIPPDLLEQAAGQSADGESATSTPGPISTSDDTSFYGQFEAQAKISHRDNGTVMHEGKEALSKLRIEMFEFTP